MGVSKECGFWLISGGNGSLEIWTLGCNLKWELANFESWHCEMETQSARWGLERSFCWYILAPFVKCRSPRDSNSLRSSPSTTGSCCFQKVVGGGCRT